jgi:hypothetical protein
MRNKSLRGPTGSEGAASETKRVNGNRILNRAVLDAYAGDYQINSD